MRRGIFLAAMVGLLAAGAWARAAEVSKIAYVDLQRALNESDAGKRARANFQAQMRRMEANLKKQREELDRLREEFDRKALLMKEEQRKSLEKDLERRTVELKRKYEDYERELKRTDSELTADILKGLQRVIQEIGKREGYTLILEASSSSILYGDPAVDLTDEVIRRYNAISGRNGKD